MRAFNELTGNSGAAPWCVGRGLFDAARLELKARSAPLLTPACLGSEFGFVADPFRIAFDGTEYIFAEVWYPSAERGQIAVFEMAGDSIRSAEVVLAEPFHLSYPCVFEADGCYYMLPEAWESGALLLYKAHRFPWTWRLCETLLRIDYADPQICFSGGLWYIFLNTDPLSNATCSIFWAESPRGPWRGHTRNPVVANDPALARSAGPFLSSAGKLLRFTQDCRRSYGGGILVSQITGLSPDHYAHRALGPLTVERPVWASTALHHVHVYRDRGHDRAVFDGYCADSTPSRT